jgi:hypothetical protein
MPLWESEDWFHNFMRGKFYRKFVIVVVV